MLSLMKVACVTRRTLVTQPYRWFGYKPFSRLPSAFLPSTSCALRQFVAVDNIHRFSSYKRLPFEVDTNVAKDVVLFKYVNERFYRLINLFGIAQCIFWAYLAQFAYTNLRDASVERDSKKELAWWQKINLGENKYRNGITVLCASLAYLFIIGTSMFTLRTVKYLVLRKGGTRMTIVTYMPFAKHRTVEMPVDHLTCAHARTQAHAFLPLKVKGYWMHFLLDKRGTYTNTALFDQTAGIQRKWKK